VHASGPTTSGGVMKVHRKEGQALDWNSEVTREKIIPSNSRAFKGCRGGIKTIGSSGE